VRRELGESLASIERHDAPIEEATTRSLEALKAYSLGEQARDSQGDAAAIPHFERAVELDPEFAVAISELGTIAGNMGRSEEEIDYKTRAYELRDRVSEPERLYIESHYFSSVLEDYDKTIETFERWKQAYPRDMTAPHNLALELIFLGDIEGALENAQISLDVAPEQPLAYHKVIFAYALLGRYDEARAVGRHALERGLDVDWIHNALSFVALLEVDHAAWEEHFEAVRGTWQEAVQKENQASEMERRGRFAEALEARRAAVVIRDRFDQASGAGMALARRAVAEALVGFPQEAVETARQALAKSRALDVLQAAGQAFALAGASEEAEAVLAELDERAPERSTLRRAVGIPSIEAILALGEGRAEEAVELLEAAKPWDGGIDQLAVLVRGQALLAADRVAEAEREMTELVQMPNLNLWSSVGQLSHLGLARAKVAAGKTDEARAAYEAFFEAYRTADPGLPVLEKARSEYEALPGVKG
jgi:tetratricopeptide (TPR) repeat protein